MENRARKREKYTVISRFRPEVYTCSAGTRGGLPLLPAGPLAAPPRSPPAPCRPGQGIVAAAGPRSRTTPVRRGRTIRPGRGPDPRGSSRPGRTRPSLADCAGCTATCEAPSRRASVLTGAVKYGTVKMTRTVKYGRIPRSRAGDRCAHRRTPRRPRRRRRLPPRSPGPRSQGCPRVRPSPSGPSRSVAAVDGPPDNGAA